MVLEPYGPLRRYAGEIARLARASELKVVDATVRPSCLFALVVNYWISRFSVLNLDPPRRRPSQYVGRQSHHSTAAGLHTHKRRPGGAGHGGAGGGTRSAATQKTGAGGSGTGKNEGPDEQGRLCEKSAGDGEEQG